MGAEMAGVMGVLFMVIVLPMVIIFHYVTKWKQTKTISREDEQMLEDLWENAEKMQSRINALETILDKTTSDWKKHT